MEIRETRASGRRGVGSPESVARRLGLSKKFVRGVLAAERFLGGEGTQPLNDGVPQTERSHQSRFRDGDKGFAVCCIRCGSTAVSVENTLQYHLGDGDWGEVTLVCDGCGDRVVLLDGIHDR